MGKKGISRKEVLDAAVEALHKLLSELLLPPPPVVVDDGSVGGGGGGGGGGISIGRARLDGSRIRRFGSGTRNFFSKLAA